MEVLNSLQVDWINKRLVKDLYLGQEAIIIIAVGESRTCITGRGVRQECPVLHLLFSIYAEMMMKEALDDVDEGVKIEGELVKDVKFADDQRMVENSEKGLQVLMIKRRLTYLLPCVLIFILFIMFLYSLRSGAK